MKLTKTQRLALQRVSEGLHPLVRTRSNGPGWRMVDGLDEAGLLGREVGSWKWTLTDEGRAALEGKAK